MVNAMNLAKRSLNVDPNVTATEWLAFRKVLEFKREYADFASVVVMDEEEAFFIKESLAAHGVRQFGPLKRNDELDNMLQRAWHRRTNSATERQTMEVLASNPPPYIPYNEVTRHGALNWFNEIASWKKLSDPAAWD